MQKRMNGAVYELIKSGIESKLSPNFLIIENESHKHKVRKKERTRRRFLAHFPFPRQRLAESRNLTSRSSWSQNLLRGSLSSIDIV